MGRPRVRDKILRAGAELLAQQGINGLTTRGVANKAGVTEASIFNNFRNKEGLIRALVTEQMSELALFSEALDKSPERDLQAWLVQVFTNARDFFSLVLPLVGPHLGHGRRAKVTRSREYYTAHAALSARLTVFQQQGLVDGSVDTDSAALLFMGAAMHSAVTRATIGDDAVGAGDEALVQGITETVARMLQP